MVDYVKTVQGNFILSGDFNVIPNSKIVQDLNELGVNQIVKHGVTNTLNPRLHRVKHLFPKGLAVDYIYTSSDLKTENLTIIQEDLSDHLGLTLEFEYNL